MSATSPDRLRKLLVFAAIVEIGTGLALLIDPALVVRLLVGANETGQRMPLARFPGIALLALGVACWPNRQRVDTASPALLAMLIYNVLIALFLAYLFWVGHIGGVLLWPGVVLHAVLALLMIGSWRNERRAAAGPGF